VGLRLSELSLIGSILTLRDGAALDRDRS
jgi:hypothetical protein